MQIIEHQRTRCINALDWTIGTVDYCFILALDNCLYSSIREEIKCNETENKMPEWIAA